MRQQRINFGGITKQRKLGGRAIQGLGDTAKAQNPEPDEYFSGNKTTDQTSPEEDRRALTETQDRNLRAGATKPIERSRLLLKYI